MGLGESTAWIVVGLSGWAVLLTSLAMVLHARDVARGRLARGTASFPLPENDTKHDSRPVKPTAPAESSLAKTELRLLHAFLPGVCALDLEMVLARGLEAAAEVGSASAAVIVLPRRAETPLIATFGLTSADSWHDRVGLPPDCGQARAVEFAHSYSESATAWDAFLLRNGVAVPIPSGEEKRGTLAIYWRRLQHQVSAQELNHLEAVARALASALKIVLRLEEARPFELDGPTGLLNARAMRRALGRECARARRYERPVAFILAQFELPLTNEALASVGQILGAAIRTVDLLCYLGEGSFAVILPEAALVDARRLHRRLEDALASGLDGLPVGLSHVAILELRDDEDPISFLDRAERELMRAAQHGTEVIGQASYEPDLARA